MILILLELVQEKCRERDSIAFAMILSVPAWWKYSATNILDIRDGNIRWLWPDSGKERHIIVEWVLCLRLMMHKITTWSSFTYLCLWEMQ